MRTTKKSKKMTNLFAIALNGEKTTQKSKDRKNTRGTFGNMKILFSCPL